MLKQKKSEGSVRELELLNECAIAFKHVRRIKKETASEGLTSSSTSFIPSDPSTWSIAINGLEYEIVTVLQGAFQAITRIQSLPAATRAIDGTSYRPPMPREGAIICSDLIGKLDVVKVACGKCERVGQYSLARLIERHGRDGKLADLIDPVAADCQKRKAANFSDRCDARCPDLPKVL